MSSAFENDPGDGVEPQSREKLEADLQSGNDQNRWTVQHRRWVFISLFVAMAVGVLVYEWIVWQKLEQTAALFVGIPTILAIILSFTPDAKTVTGIILKGITFALLAMGILFQKEGLACVLMSAPIFYVIGALVGFLLDHFRNKKKVYAVAIPVLMMMSMEGVTTPLSFSRDEQVVVEKVVVGSELDVRRQLAKRPIFRTPIPMFFKIGFPLPKRTLGNGLVVGDKRVIHFAGGEGKAGDLVLTVSAVGKNWVCFSLVKDQSHIAHWLKWKDLKISWQKVGKKQVKVRWQQQYTRLLDPAWYFGPLEKFAVKVMVGYLLENLAQPQPHPNTKAIAKR